MLHVILFLQRHKSKGFNSVERTLLHNAVFNLKERRRNNTWCSVEHNSFYHIDTSILLENVPLVKFIRNHIRDSSGVFSTSSLVRISMLSEISSLSLRLYLNSWCMIKISSGLPRMSPAIFGNLRKISENVQQHSCNLRTNFGAPSEIFGKSSITPSLVCLYNKKNITR